MRTDGQTDRHDEANSRFLQFCERAYKPNSARVNPAHLLEGHFTSSVFFLLSFKCLYI